MEDEEDKKEEVKFFVVVIEISSFSIILTFSLRSSDVDLTFGEFEMRMWNFSLLGEFAAA